MYHEPHFSSRKELVPLGQPRYTFTMQRFNGIELKKITLNTLFQFLIRLSTSFSTLIATLLIAYLSGYELLGSFTKIVAFVSVFYLIVDFGMNPMFLKTYFQSIEKNLGNLLVLRVIMSLLIIPIVCFIALTLPYNPTHSSGFSPLEKNGILIFSLTILTMAIQISLQTLLQKNLAYKLSILPSFISSIVLIGLIYVGVTQDNLPLILFAYVLAGGVVCVLLGLLLKGVFSLRLTLHKFIPFAKNLFLLSLPLGVMIVFNVMYSKSDIFLIALFQSNKDVGTYGISYRFFEVAISIPTFLSNSIYPLLLDKLTNSKDYTALLRKYLQLFGAFSVAGTVLVVFFSPILQIIKPEFVTSVAPLQILSLSIPFFFLTSLLQWHFLIKGKMKFLVLLYFFALVTSIILNLIFIPKYSYMAAAIITVFSEGLVFFAMLWYFRETNRPQ